MTNFTLCVRCFAFFTAILLVAGAGLVRAQTQASGPATQAAPPTLAEALARAEPVDPGVVLLAVDADNTKLPKDAAAPAAEDTYEDIAAVYNRLTQPFDMVSAIAPPTMTVMNDNPPTPDPQKDMSSYEALILLLATLTDVQWQEITSAQGLPISELTSDYQHELIGSMISAGGKLIVIPIYGPDEKYDDKDKLDLTDELPTCRLRLAETLSVQLPAKDEPNSHFGQGPLAPEPGAPRSYQITDREEWHEDNLVQGVSIQAHAPNVPKPSQLDYDMDALQRSVPLNGVRTAGDLVTHISAATHVEIYADRRLASKPVTLIGAPSARGSELLRALSFCLTSTYRQVGTAYVLTADSVGAATRRQLWIGVDQEAQILRGKPVDEAANIMYDNRSPSSLSWFGDPDQLTPDQMKQIDPSGKSKVPNGELEATLSQLSPPQQDYMRALVENFNAMYAPAGQQSTTDGKFDIRPAIKAQMIVPSLDQPVDMGVNDGSLDLGTVFQQRWADQEYVKRQKAETAKLIAQPVDEAVLATLIAAQPNAPARAVIVHPRDAAGVDADIAAMQTLDLNQMWLDVFSGGAPHISTASPQPADNDILTEALAKTAGTEIKVYAMLDLLSWGESTPASLRDVNDLGQTYEQAVAWHQQLKAQLAPPQMMPGEYSGTPSADFPGVAVSTGEIVESTLASVIGRLAKAQGIAGIVLSDAIAPGYQSGENSQDLSPLSLGYTPEIRLRFLRQEHADPLDVFPPGTYFNGEDMTAPPVYEYDFKDNNALHTAWTAFLASASQKFLAALYTTANADGPAAAARVPFFVQQPIIGPTNTDGMGRPIHPPQWYISWKDPGQSPFPGNPGWNSASSPPGAVMSFTYDDWQREAPYLDTHRGVAGKPLMPSFVLDLAADPFGDNGAGSDPLTNLASKSPQPTPAPPAVVPPALSN